MSNFCSQNNVEHDAVLELKHPVAWGSEGLITHLAIRRVKFKDQRAAAKVKDETAATVELIARLTAMPPPFIDEMDVEDVVEASDIIKGFMPKPRKDGDSGSEPSQEE